MEIGPGDDFGLCRLLIQAGATRMYAVEKYTTPAPPPGVVSLTGEAESMSLPEPVDFAVSNDVLEHVRDVPGTFRSVFTALQPGGVFVSSVDLRGHNCWKSDARPLDFLTCPDWLYRLATCNIETSNRVRFGVLAVAAREVGFKAVHSVALATVDPIYLADVRPHLLPRYQALPDDDLGILQALIVARKSV
jgi:SAM-dependent methyltransferase